MTFCPASFLRRIRFFTPIRPACMSADSRRPRRRGMGSRPARGRAVLHSGGGEEQDMPGEDPLMAGRAVSGGPNGFGRPAPSRRPRAPISAGAAGGARRARSAPASRSPRRSRRAGRSGDRPVGRHRRGHAARHVRRRHGRGAAVGHLADPRARPHRGRERRAAQPRRRPQRRRCSAPKRCSTCATSASSFGAATRTSRKWSARCRWSLALRSNGVPSSPSAAG